MFIFSPPYLTKNCLIWTQTGFLNIYSSPPRPVWHLQVRLGTERKVFLFIFDAFSGSCSPPHCLIHIPHLSSWVFSVWGEWKIQQLPLHFLCIGSQVCRSALDHIRQKVCLLDCILHSCLIHSLIRRRPDSDQTMSKFFLLTRSCHRSGVRGNNKENQNRVTEQCGVIQPPSGSLHPVIVPLFPAVQLLSTPTRHLVFVVFLGLSFISSIVWSHRATGVSSRGFIMPALRADSPPD